jgi:hypothetical protein
LEYCMAILYILWSSGKIFLFWYVVPRKIWQPGKNEKNSEVFLAHPVHTYKNECDNYDPILCIQNRKIPFFQTSLRP